MTEIPADVMKRAVECAGNMQGSLDTQDTEIIARAIMAATEAERERCAKIAEEEMCGDDYGAVAAAIRAGTKGASQ